MLIALLSHRSVYLALVFLLAVAVRVAILPPNAAPRQWSDEDEYDTYAWNLASGKGYSGPNSATRDRDHLTSRRMPGPSVAFALVYKLAGHRYSLAVLLNIVLMAASCVVLFYLGLQLFDERVARWSALIFAVWPHSIYLSISLLSEPMFVFFWYLFVLHSLRLARQTGFKNIIVSGLLLGSVIYARPHVLFLPFVALWIVLVFWGSWARVLSCCSVFLIVAAMLVPWTVRNYRVHRAFVPLATQGPLTLLAANNRITASDPMYYGNTLSWEGGVPEYNKELGTISNEIAYSKRTMELAKEWILSNPDKWWYLLRSRFVRFWSPFLHQANLRNRILMLCSWGPVLILFIWPFCASLYRYWRARDARIMVHFAVFSIIAHAFIFSGLARYRFPIEGFCIVFACAAGLRMWDNIARHGRPSSSAMCEKGAS